MANRADLKISDIGEKRIIAELIKPLFNSECEETGIGDDCAMISSGDEYILLSTDRVPADLTAFRLGLIDYSGLGAYLVNLNLSDIAACGGTPIGLLLNLGLPTSMLFDDLKKLCLGALKAAISQSARILGGDLSSSRDISISATSVGRILKREVLTRESARPGNLVFTSRSIGLTPAAFGYFLKLRPRGFRLSDSEEDCLSEQFKLPPLVALGRALATSGSCTSCMDNTDGLGQTLGELAALSGVSLVLDLASIQLPTLVEKVARELQMDPIPFAFGPGADFGLVGTLLEDTRHHLLHPKLQPIGICEVGAGVVVRNRGCQTILDVSGWNYFN